MDCCYCVEIKAPKKCRKPNFQKLVDEWKPRYHLILGDRPQFSECPPNKISATTGKGQLRQAFLCNNPCPNNWFTTSDCQFPGNMKKDSSQCQESTKKVMLCMPHPQRSQTKPCPAPMPFCPEQQYKKSSCCEQSSDCVPCCPEIVSNKKPTCAPPLMCVQCPEKPPKRACNPVADKNVQDCGFPSQVPDCPVLKLVPAKNCCPNQKKLIGNCQPQSYQSVGDCPEMTNVRDCPPKKVLYACLPNTQQGDCPEMKKERKFRCGGCLPKNDCSPCGGDADGFLVAQDYRVRALLSKPKQTDYLYRCESRELLGSKLLKYCLCIRRNGLQDDCPRTPCKGRPACLLKPWPNCWPSGGCHGIDYERQRGFERVNPSLEYRMDNKVCGPCDD